MRLLLDTYVFLWTVTASRQPKAQTRAYLASAEAVFVSAASIREIAIKSQRGKVDGGRARALARDQEKRHEQSRGH
jgi:PIN domain nuclease of toxin-antitoxin system